MAKRFINPNWKELRKLSSSLVQAWFYLWDKADEIGVYEYEPGYMSVDIGEAIPFEALCKLPGVEKISEEKLLLKEFIVVNYGCMKPDYNPHKPAFRALLKNGLELNSSLNQACLKLEDEDEDEDEGKDEIGKEGMGEKPITEVQTRKRKPTVKQADEVTLTIRMETDWDAHLKKHHDQSYYQSAANRSALKLIKSKLLHNAQEKLKGKNLAQECSDDQLIIESWRSLLNNFDKWDDFEKKMTELTQINNRLSNIISAIKNPRHEQHSKNFGNRSPILTGRVEPAPHGTDPGQF